MGGGYGRPQEDLVRDSYSQNTLYACMRSQIVNYCIKKVKLLSQERGSVDTVLVLGSTTTNPPHVNV